MKEKKRKFRIGEALNGMHKEILLASIRCCVYEFEKDLAPLKFITFSFDAGKGM